MNKVLMQYFHWYLRPETNLWNQLKENAFSLKKKGIDMLWLPPAYKCNGGINDVGYGVYDLYDLGEFNQKGTIRTKYGTKDQYIAAIDTCHQANLLVLADMVFNHRMGADYMEKVEASEVDQFNRLHYHGGNQLIDAWTGFDFKGRNDIYSSFHYDHTCFDGVDYDNRTRKNSIYQFKGKSWDKGVDDENGNYDYLMGADLDFSNPKIVEELHRYGKWVLDFTNVDGFRLDALKHIDDTFFFYWLMDLRNQSKKELFTVGEYWSGDINTLVDYLEINQHQFSLFDVPLHYHFAAASNSNGEQDLGALFNNTLVERIADCAVTFVENHDTQAGQALQSPVLDWFKPSAYACILLRHEGIPCIFYGDYYGDSNAGLTSFKNNIDSQLWVRKHCMYGIRYDYFDDANIIGWSYEGISRNTGLVVLFTDQQGGEKQMQCGALHANSEYINIFDTNCTVILDEIGVGKFIINAGSLAIYIPRDAHKTYIDEI